MNLDLNTLTNYGFTFFDDELNENDLKNLAEGTSESYTTQLTTVVSVSLIDLKVEVDDDQEIGEPESMEVERNVHSPSSEHSSVSGKDQVLMVIDQYNNQQSRSPSPAVSETSSAASTDTLPLDDEDTPPILTEKTKAKRGRKIKLPRDVVPGEFYCEKCKKNFRSKQGLKQHTNSHHTGVKAHGCEICGKRFDLLEEMKKHRERHSTENKPFGCRIDGCPKRFMYEFDMDRHVAVRHGKSSIKCDLCSKVFGRRDHLEKHAISHKFNTVKKC